jgi:hypothetical protein
MMCPASSFRSQTDGPMRTRTLAGVAFKLRLCNLCGDDVVAHAVRDDFEAMGVVKQFD